MRREIPLIIVFLFGLFMIVQFFIPHRSFAFLYQEFNNWTIIIGIFTMVVGIGSLTTVHYSKIKSKKPGWGYSVALP